RVDVLNKRDSGPIRIVLRIPKWWGFKPVRLKQGEVSGVPPGCPIRDISLRDGRGKAISVGDRPVGEHAATASTGDCQLLGIDVASFHDFYNPSHQVAKAIAGIAILNYFSKLLAITGRAARIGI